VITGKGNKGLFFQAKEMVMTIIDSKVLMTAIEQQVMALRVSL
jgi:hypothetical protein